MSLAAIVKASSVFLRDIGEAVRPLKQTENVATLRAQQKLMERAFRENGPGWLVTDYNEVSTTLVPEWDLGQALRDYFKAALSEPIPADMMSILKRIDGQGVAA